MTIIHVGVALIVCWLIINAIVGVTAFLLRTPVLGSFVIAIIAMACWAIMMKVFE